jgi:hypothetical protein
VERHQGARDSSRNQAVAPWLVSETMGHRDVGWRTGRDLKQDIGDGREWPEETSGSARTIRSEGRRGGA